MSAAIERVLREALAGTYEPTGDDYRRIAAELCGYLRGRFSDSPLRQEDFEEAAADAYIQLLRANEPVLDPIAWLKNTAKARALDQLRKRKARPSDPVEGDDSIFERSDEAPSIEDRLDQRALLARIRVVMGTLSDEHRAALLASEMIGEGKLTVAEACERLGVPRSTFHDRVKRASLTLQAGVAPERWQHIQRRLLTSCASGIADAAERRRAKLLLATDPVALALFRELRGLHREAAALVPAGLVADGGSITERGGAAFERVREAAVSLFARGGEGADVASGAAAAGAGGATGAGGALAKLAAVGAVPKVVAACLGTGAAATACVAAGVVPGVELPGKDGHKPAIERSVDEVALETPYPISAVELEQAPSEPASPQPAAESEPESESAATEGTETSVPETPLAEPDAPAEEFEPVGEVASASPSSGGGGGGSASGGGGSGGGGGGGAGSDFGP